MYKGRIAIWVVILGIATIFSGILARTKDAVYYNIYINSEESALVNCIDQYSHKGMHFQVVNDKSQADIIISDSSKENIEGFKKFENQFTVPIVVYAPSQINGEYSGFVHYQNPSYLEINLIDFVHAVEEGKTWGDLNVSSRVFALEFPVKLALPSKISPYYDEIIDVVRFAISDYNIENMYTEETTKRLETVISKSDIYTDPISYRNNIIKNEETSVLILAPEYNNVLNDDFNSSRNYYDHLEVIPKYTNNIYFDLYIKEDIDIEGISDELKTLKFLDFSGLRNKNKDYDIGYSREFSNTPNYISSLS